MDLSQYAELFLVESREHLSSINQQLLEWERSPQATEPVAGIFRAVHTIKGMAAAMSYSVTSDLAHRMESLLDILRTGDGEVTQDHFELLFRATDTLEQAVAASVSGREGQLDVAEVLAALDAATRDLGAAARRPSRSSMPLVAVSEGPGIWIRVQIEPNSTLVGARAAVVIGRMEAIGAVREVRPPPSAFESDEFDGQFDFQLETELDPEAIEREIRAAGDIKQVLVGAERSRTDVKQTASGRSRHVRVDLQRVDSMMDLIGELVTARDQLTQVSAARTAGDLDDLTLKISRLTSDLQAEIIQVRMTPVWQVFDRFPRLVRDLARQLDKQVEFRVEGKEIELDRAILDEIGDPLVHLLRNAIDHGIEPPAEREALGKPPTGRVVLSALREKAKVAIKVSDDGRGIEREKILDRARRDGMVGDEVETLSDELLLRVLARSGFSTAAEVSDVSGRGVGIDIVATRLRALGGGLEVSSEIGVGTTFTLQLPITLAIVRALTVEVGDERYVLPITHVTETLDLDSSAVTELDGRAGLMYRGTVIPLVDLRELVNVSGIVPDRRPVVVVQIGGRRSGVVVDTLTGQQEIVVKSFDPPSGTLPIFSGATILGDGMPVLVLDAGGLV
ncbi:MAG: chemotaxis protein CheA [Gemmatimonadota bacterium]|nr:MAG: chemotaxis protein CheA [Gemmatimonadota bacterium]